MLAAALSDIVPGVKEYEAAIRQEIHPVKVAGRTGESATAKLDRELATLADRLVNGLKNIEAELGSMDIEDLECLIEQARAQIRTSSESNAIFGEKLRDLSQLASAKKPPFITHKLRRLTDRVKRLRTMNARVLSAYTNSLATLERTLSARRFSYTDLWHGYLQSLGEQGSGLTVELAALVREFWAFASSHAAAPDASPTDDGVLLVWDKAATKHLQVEIFADSTYDWFYRDRGIEGYESGEGIQLGRYGPDLIDHLRKFS
jgi:hypothetical protein